MLELGTYGGGVSDGSSYPDVSMRGFRMWKSPADLMDDYDLLHAVVRRLLTFHVIKVGVFILHGISGKMNT